VRKIELTRLVAMRAPFKPVISGRRKLHNRTVGSSIGDDGNGRRRQDDNGG
jgi:hypothetical protein